MEGNRLRSSSSRRGNIVVLRLEERHEELQDGLHGEGGQIFSFFLGIFDLGRFTRRLLGERSNGTFCKRGEKEERENQEEMLERGRWSQPTILLNLLSIFLAAKLLPHCFNACTALHLIRVISFQIRGIILGLALLLMFYAGEMQICAKPALRI